MQIFTTDPLFAWERLEESPTLQTLQQFLDQLPDGPLLAALHRHRGRGRDDYPIAVLWRVHVLRYLCRHPSMDAGLAEFQRNADLRRLAGMGPGQKVPSAGNMSRFLQVLGRPEHLALLRTAFQKFIGHLAAVVPDLGRHVAGDASALHARAAMTAEPDTSGLPQPNKGRKEYRDDTGKVTEAFEWFGYKFHLLVDIRHEVVLDYRITEATRADVLEIPALLEGAKEVLPPQRLESFAFDKAADSAEVHNLLHQAKIKPVIEIRALWKQEKQRLLPDHIGGSNVVHDEAGTIFCLNTVAEPPICQKMAYAGYEAQRGTLKYRCPARAGGYACSSDAKCNGTGTYGKTVRVKCETDLRRFPPIPRATKEFERRYDGRTAVERVNARVKLFWGPDDGNVYGAARFHAHVATIMLVHAGYARMLAAAPRKDRQSLSPTRLTVIAQRLQEAELLEV